VSGAAVFQPATGIQLPEPAFTCAGFFVCLADNLADNRHALAFGIMARLVVISRSLAGSAFDLGADWTSLGRADGNAFQLLEPSVSGRHCEVRTLGDNLVVRDLLSTNGTFVNGEKVTEGVAKPGQTLRLGEVELRYESSAPGPLSGAPFNSKMLVTSLSALAAKPAAAAAAKPEPEISVPIAPAGADNEFIVVATYDGKWVPTGGSEK
jgi:hypothetical protein